MRLEGYRAWHFPRDEWGAYAGHHPATSVEAIGASAPAVRAGRALSRVSRDCRMVARTLPRARRSPRLRSRLAASADGVCVIYELCESAAFDAFAVDGPDERRGIGVRHAARATAPATLTRLTRPEPRRSLRVLTILARFGSEQYARCRTRDRGSVRPADARRRATRLIDRRQRAAARFRRRARRRLAAHRRRQQLAGVLRVRSRASISSVPTSGRTTSCTSRRARSTPYTWHISNGSSRRCWRRSRAGAACIGHIDCYNEPIEVRGVSLPSIGSGRASSSCRRRKSRRWAVSCPLRMDRPFFSGRSRRTVPCRRANQHAISGIHHAVADRRRRGPGSELAFDVRAHATRRCRIRAEGARDPQRATSERPAPGARLSSDRRDVAVDDVAPAHRATFRCRRRGASSSRIGTATRVLVSGGAGAYELERPRV